MPRNPSGVYSAPPGTTAVSGTTIASAAYNSLKDDLVQDANTARPVVAGGTGAATDVMARENLGVYGRSLLIDTTGTTAEAAYDNQVIDFTTSGTLTTEPAADLGDGWRCYVFASGGDVTINPNLDETVNGLATLVVPMGASGVLSVYNGNFRFEFYGSSGRSRFLADKNGVGQTVRDEKITFTNEVEDTAGIFDPTNSRVTPKAGEVMILHASITAPLSENNWEVVLYKNGARFRSFMNGPLGGTGFKSGSVLAIVVGNGTDYYEVFLETTLTVGGFTVFGDPVQTWFEGWSV